MSANEGSKGFNYSRLGESEEEFGYGGSKRQPWSLCRIPFRNLARATVSLPLGGFIFCVLWAMYSDLEAATYTHCGVKNYLPSLSAAMGGFPLSQKIWRICIALHAAPRFVVTAMYYRYLRSIIMSRYIAWVALACILNILENLGLIGLTYVSSRENYQLYMLIMCALLYCSRNIPATSLETKSLKVKWRLVMVNLVSFAMAGYAFIRHNAHCEAGMYTVFAFLEYLVVLTNMGFHMTAYWDFYDRVLTLDFMNFSGKSYSSNADQLPFFYYPSREE